MTEFEEFLDEYYDDIRLHLSNGGSLKLALDIAFEAGKLAKVNELIDEIENEKAD